MRRVTVTIPDDLEVALDSYIAEQAAAPSVTAVVQASLKRFLAESRSEASAPTLGCVLRNRDRIVEVLDRRGVSNVRLFADMQAQLQELLDTLVHLLTDGAMTDEQRAAVDAEALQL